MGMGYPKGRADCGKHTHLTHVFEEASALSKRQFRMIGS